MSSEHPRIALAQMEVFPGRPDLNLASMARHIEQARRQRAEVVGFPEMCLPGYFLGDLWEQDTLVRDFAAYSERVRALSDGLTVVFGNVAVDENAVGEDGRLRKYNAVQVCHDGAFVKRAGLPEIAAAVAPKTLHPNYRYFDDDRHFYSVRKLALALGVSIESFMVPFQVPLTDGRPFRFGVQLCEDIWCQDYCYADSVLDTLRMWAANGAQAVFNLSASPWTLMKNAKRNRVVQAALTRSPVPFFYINQVGAQNNGKNILVFDGDTTAYSAQATVQARAVPWKEELVVVEPDARFVPPVVQEDDCASRLAGIVSGVRHLDHVRGAPNRFLVGVSGGVDSALVLCLLVRAVGRERVFAVNMPTRFNSQRTRDNARVLCEALGVALGVCPIQDHYERLASTLREAELGALDGEYSRLVDENVQARIRGADILSGLSARFGLVYTNNGNKTETALGYATLYGDVNGAIAPIADLYKTEVFELARYFNDRIHGREVIPENLLSGETVPSAELSEAQDVTRGLGDPIKYGYHDALLRQLIEFRHHPADLMQWMLEGTLLARIQWPQRARFLEYFQHGRQWLEDLDWVTRAIRVNYFKRIQAPPIIVLSKRAFGFDLRESQLSEYHPEMERGLRARVHALDLHAHLGVDGCRGAGA